MENFCLESAINAMNQNNYIDYSSITLVDPTRSIEDLVVKKDLYEKLSPEAKEVIEVTTNRPIKFIIFIKNNSKSFLKHRSLNYKLNQIYDRKNRGYKFTPSMESRLTNINLIKAFFGWKEQKWVTVTNEIRNFCDS